MSIPEGTIERSGLGPSRNARRMPVEEGDNEEITKSPDAKQGDEVDDIDYDEFAEAMKPLHGGPLPS